MMTRTAQETDGGGNIEAIHIQIRTHESAIAIIDDEICGLMRTVRQLEFKKLKHAEGIRHCKGLITLARRLPIEILASIFEMCVQDGYTRTPLVVSHVCAQWRKAASLPSVWSHIYVDLDDYDPFNRTRFWLARAGDSSLRITLEIRQDQTRLLDVINILLEKRNKWGILTINSALLANVNRTLMACTGLFPQLHTLHVSIPQELHESDGNGINMELVSLRTVFQDAPKLSTVHLVRNALPAPSVLPSSITNLSLVLPSYRFASISSIESVLLVLEDLHHLEKFSMILPAGPIHAFEPVEDTTRLVSLPHLYSITLTGGRDMYNLLLHLVTPCLRFLHLRSSDDLGSAPDERTGQCLLFFLVRASPPLEELELRDADIPASYLIQCFSSLSQLKTLRLHESEISDDVLYQLYGQNGLCPLLSILDFRWCGFLTGRTLVGLVQSRLHHPSTSKAGTNVLPDTIAKVTVIYCSFVKTQDIADLASLTLCQVVVDLTDYCCECSYPINWSCNSRILSKAL